MKIAILMAAAGSRLGGLETAAREFAAGLARRGHAVTLVTGVGPGAPLHPDLRAGAVPCGIRTAPMLGQASPAARLLARARGVHPAVVEARTFWAAARRDRALVRWLNAQDVVGAFFEVDAVAASHDLTVPIVYYYAGPLDPRRLARGRFARVVAISRMAADYHAAQAARFALPRIAGVVTPGVRDDQIAAGPGPRVADMPPEALFTGRLDLTAEKRVDRLIAWWPPIAAAVPGARLTLAGGGTALPQLRQTVTRLGLGELVSLPGPVPHAQMFARLQQASLYVFPSSFETFGIAPLEALGAGLPVVASDLPALHESLGAAALLLPVADEAAWVRTLTRLLADPGERLTWAARGPQQARQLTWDRQTAAYEAHLVAAAESASASSGAARSARRSAQSV
jgi:glycosyltransferase involved in cell wall biosynthesis